VSTFTVLNPATAQPVREVALADVAATDEAIERAHAAFPAWRDLAPG
jgi:acyl-CoA reductase-like NAD-dependent aldehyde dehydrogenase